MQNPNKTTKDKILDLLKKEGSLTVNELTSSLNITHMAVRKHLNHLEKDGLILSTVKKQPMGRPVQSYFLSDKGERLFPKSYETISVEILHDMKELHGEESIHYFFKKREQRQTNEYSSRMLQKSTLQKIKEMVAIQNEKGYMADFTEMDKNTYEIIEYNCPIIAIAQDFKMACNCETEMLKNVLDADQITRTCCRINNDKHCKFLIKFSDKKTSSR